MTRSSILLRFSFAMVLIVNSFFLTVNLTAQDNVDLQLSGAATIGYAPQITYGANENSGVVVGFFGELKYGKAVGRLQFTKPLLSTFEENDNLDGGEAYHGALGYRLDLSKKFFIDLLASGGATVIHYNNSFNSNSGDSFTNVSPQVGIIVAPTHQISRPLSLQLGLRYYKGFKAGDRTRASNLADVSIGLRFTL